MCRRSSTFLLPLTATLALAAFGVTPAGAQDQPEYRALWVDTFNTALGTRPEIDRVIQAAVDGRLNAIFAQVRRRGDSWYLDTLEPLTQVAGVGEPDATGTWTLDPLQYLIEQAHARNIEVHAFVIVGSIYNAHPTITGLPRDPAHVFNQHFWDRTRTALYPDDDPRQWSTRALPHNQAGTTFSGHRFTAQGEWYIDLGHPDAAAYTVDVLTHLVSRYDVDGIHLDRIRYPEAPIDQPTGSPLVTWGINVGYNETSVNRFKARYGTEATYYTDEDIGRNVSSNTAPAIITAADVGYPRTNDPLWNDWRREQVTSFVRRLYLSVTAVKPRIKVSAALICFFTGPTASLGWHRTEAHYRVFQDWRAWMQEGILDIAAPMIYKREHVTAERAQYDDWLAFTKMLARDNGRHGIAGLGAFINSIEGTLRQSRRAQARAPFESNNVTADGVIFFALGNSTPGNVTTNSTNAAVTNNPFSYPIAGVSTPRRPNADFFAALTTNRTAAGALLESDAYGPLFPSFAPAPDMPWKTAPTLGHAMGFAISGSGPLDGAWVTVERLDGAAVPPRTTRTDGGGFFGLVGLQPGLYRAHAVLGVTRLDVCSVTVSPGIVTTMTPRADTLAPVTSVATNPGPPNGDGGWYLGDVGVTLTALDDCSGVARTEYSIDNGATWQAYTGPFTISAEGTTIVHYRSADAAGNTETPSAVTLRIDKTDPTLTLTAQPREIWPPDGRLERVNVKLSAADAVSGLSGVSYQIIDEYGMTFGIAPRALSGAAAEWADSVELEAWRNGEDLDGREYRIIATVRDAAGRTASVTFAVIVVHDRK